MTAVLSGGRTGNLR